MTSGVQILLLLLMVTPGVIGLLVLLALAIEQLSARPQDSKIRQAIDRTCRLNGLRSTRVRLVTALILVLLSVLLIMLALRDSSWAGMGGAWFAHFV